MELVTGRAGSPHITSQQDRQKHQGIWGDGAYILATGNQLEPQVQSSNKILIKDGALMFQGALFSVKVGTTDEITINNGNQGMQRKDLVVARYTYDSSQNIESAEWVVIQGEPAASNPVAPEGTSGDIQAGDAVVDCPFMIVNLDGINVTGVDIIPEVLQTIPELIGKFKVINFKTGAQLNTDYTIPLPDGCYFYNTALLSFQVVMGGAMRDGINNNAISTANSGNYRVLNSQALNAEAYVVLYKYR